MLKKKHPTFWLPLISLFVFKTLKAHHNSNLNNIIQVIFQIIMIKYK